MEEAKTDNSTKPQSCAFAILSLFLGIAGIISIVSCLFSIPVIFSVMAVIFGIVALVKINASKGLLAGKSEAIAGIVLGGLWFVATPLIAIVKPGFSPISLPGIVSSRIYNNENSAIASLKVMLSVEAAWLQQDTDNNGVKDYWTYDVSCFFRALHSDNETNGDLMSLDVAKADAKPARTDAFGNKYIRITSLPEATPIPYNGYYFQMMDLDQDGKPYNQGKVNGVPATNNHRFAIVAYPAIYESAGVYTFIVNQEGTMYATDCGSDSKKIVLQWPGNNPSAMRGPGGGRWGLAEYRYGF